MPVLDGEDKVVGLVQMEKKDSGSYCRCYLVLDFGTHKLKIYPEEAEVHAQVYTTLTPLSLLLAG